jgi:hypothetical protein
MIVMMFIGMDVTPDIVRRNARRIGNSSYHIKPWKSASYGLKRTNECLLEKRSTISPESIITFADNLYFLSTEDHTLIFCHAIIVLNFFNSHIIES